MNFIITFILGTCVVILDIEVIKDQAAVSLIALPFIMACSAFISWINLKRTKINSIEFERQADNQYALGFLFTLLALVVPLTLAFFNESTIESTKLVGQFGAALTTTIAGILLRTLMLSGVKNLYLSEKSNNDNTNLQYIAQEILDQLGRIEINLDKAVTVTQPQYSSNIAMNSDDAAIRDNISEFVEELASTKKEFGNIKASLTRLNKSIDTSIDKQEAFIQTSETLSQMNTQLENTVNLFQTIGEVNKSYLSPFVESIKDLSQNSDEAISRTEELKNAHEALQKSMEQTSSVAKIMSDSNEEASNIIQTVSNSYDTAIKTFADMSSQMEKAYNIIENNIGDLNHHIQKLETFKQTTSDANREAENINDTIKTSSEQVNNLSQNLEGITKAAADKEEEIKGMFAGLDALLEKIKNSELIKSIDKFVGSIESQTKSIKTLTDKIVEALNKKQS